MADKRFNNLPNENNQPDDETKPSNPPDGAPINPDPVEPAKAAKPADLRFDSEIEPKRAEVKPADKPSVVAEKAKDNRKSQLYTEIDKKAELDAKEFYDLNHRQIVPSSAKDKLFVDKCWDRISEDRKGYAEKSMPDLKAHYTSRLATAVSNLVVLK